MSLYQEYTVTLEHSESGNESIPRVHCISTMQSLLVASGLLRAKTTTVQSDRSKSFAALVSSLAPINETEISRRRCGDDLTYYPTRS